MALDVESPAPPDLTNRSLPTAIDPDETVDATGDLRRQELEDALRDGAWDDAFEEWAEYTDLSESEYRAVHHAGLVEELDLFWHPDRGTVEFELPPIPDRIGGDASLASRAASELSDLGEIVADVLTASVDWTATESEEEL